MQPGKRKLAATNTRSTRGRQPAYFLPELAHVVAAADERVPFVNLAQEVCINQIIQIYIISLYYHSRVAIVLRGARNKYVCVMKILYFLIYISKSSAAGDNANTVIDLKH